MTNLFDPPAHNTRAGGISDDLMFGDAENNIHYLSNRFQLLFDFENYRRIIGQKEVVIHCHHYNARLQNIIEKAKQINGKEILLSSTEEIFAGYIKNFFLPEDNLEDKWKIAASLYSNYGYGTLDFRLLDEGVITSPSSHFVEGWKAGFKEVNCPICTFTEGYLQGVIYGITGKSVYVQEEACMQAGAEQCKFRINYNRSTTPNFSSKYPLNFQVKPKNHGLISNIDREKVVDSLSKMDFIGNSVGLIPKFNVYLANMPADYYNLICIRFIEKMKEINLLNTAKQLLFYAGEVCAVNTLRGIIFSNEWDDLIFPMIKKDDDYLHGLVAVTNSLGWGNWQIIDYQAGEYLKLESFNGYEALGYLQYRGETNDPQCYMLAGVAAGMMELLHGEGTVEERIGTYYSEETSCICCHQSSCNFLVESV